MYAISYVELALIALLVSKSYTHGLQLQAICRPGQGSHGLCLSQVMQLATEWPFMRQNVSFYGVIVPIPA